MTRGSKKLRKKEKEQTRRRQESEQRDDGKLEVSNTPEMPKPIQQVPEETVEKLAKYLKNDEMQELYKVFADQNTCIEKNLGRLTPLMWAVKNKSLEMIDLLLKHGADVSATDADGNNAILLAPQSHGWRQESFLDLWNAVKDVEALDVNHANAAGVTILHYAAKKEWETLIESLVEKRARVNCVTKKGVSPLMLAGSGNYCKMVKQLLRAGADVALEDERGCTVLCYAIAYMIQKGKQTSTIRALVSAFNDEPVTMEDYLQRRFDLLTTPPIRVARSTETIANILTTVVNFFVRHIKYGLETLLELRVFLRLAEATRDHSHDAHCCHALIGVMFELVRYCSCCCGDSLVTEEHLATAFVKAGAADACLLVLKTHGGTDEVLCAALMPLFSVCSIACGAALHWLQIHSQELKPFYKRFLQFYLICCNFCNTDERHFRFVKKRITAFKKVMNGLLEKKVHHLAKDKFNKKLEPVNPKDVQCTRPQTEPKKKDEDTLFQNEDSKEQLEDIQLQVLGTCSKKVRRKAAKALKMKLAKKRAQEMVERNLKTIDSLLPDFISTADKHQGMSKNQGTDATVGSDITISNGDEDNMKPNAELSHVERHVDNKPGDWVTLWDHTFTDNSSSVCSYENTTTDQSMERCSYENTNTDQSMELLNTLENKNVQIKNEDGYAFENDGLFVLEANGDKSNIVVSEENRLHLQGAVNINVGNLQMTQETFNQSDASEQIDASSLLTCETSEIRDDGCDTSHSSDLFAKAGYNNKQINDASYFDSLFKDILTKYLKMWQLERENSYPGHRVHYYDARHTKIKQDLNLLKLDKILPGLEQEYIQRLETRWKSLTSKLQRIGREKFEKIAGRLFALLKYFTRELDSKLQCMDFESRTRKRPWTTESVDFYAGSVEPPFDKKPRIISAYGQPRATSPSSATHPNIATIPGSSSACNVFQLCEEYDHEGTANVVSCLQENPPSSNDDAIVLDTSFSAAVKRSKTVGLGKAIEHKHQSQEIKLPTASKHQSDVVLTRTSEIPACGHITTTSPSDDAAQKDDSSDEATDGNLAHVTADGAGAEKLYVPPPPPGFSVQPTSHRVENLATVARFFSPNERCMQRFRPESPSSSRWDALVSSIQTMNAAAYRPIETTEPFSVSKSRYTISSNGSFGNLELGVDTNGAPIVVKSIDFQNDELLDCMKQMLNSLTTLRHQHIAHYTCYSQQGNVLFLAIPLFECNLGEYVMALKMRNLCKARGSELMRQIVSGLHYLHTNAEPIIHGNLKPTNVLISIKGSVKLADFGFNQIHYTMVWPQLSSLVWWASESHSSFQLTCTVDWTLKSDIAVAGMLLHFVESGGSHPFGDEPHQIIQNIVAHQPLLKTSDPELEELVTTMIQRDPGPRPSVTEVARHTVFWDDAKKWRLVTACAGMITECRHLPLSYVEDLHNYFDKKLASSNTFRNWPYAVSGSGRFPEMLSVQDEFTNTASGLLRFIRMCVERGREPARLSFPLRTFFLTAFPTLPMTLHRLVENTEWMEHYALDKFKP